MEGSVDFTVCGSEGVMLAGTGSRRRGRQSDGGFWKGDFYKHAGPMDLRSGLVADVARVGALGRFKEKSDSPHVVSYQYWISADVARFAVVAGIGPHGSNFKTSRSSGFAGWCGGVGGCLVEWGAENRMRTVVQKPRRGGAFSYSHSQLGAVIRYIQNQERHHARKTFREEYLALLKRFEVPHEERFIFKDVA